MKTPPPKALAFLGLNLAALYLPSVVGMLSFFDRQHFLVQLLAAPVGAVAILAESDVVAYVVLGIVLLVVLVLSFALHKNIVAWSMVPSTLLLLSVVQIDFVNFFVHAMYGVAHS